MNSPYREMASRTQNSYHWKLGSELLCHLPKSSTTLNHKIWKLWCWTHVLTSLFSWQMICFWSFLNSLASTLEKRPHSLTYLNQRKDFRWREIRKPFGSRVSQNTAAGSGGRKHLAQPARLQAPLVFQTLLLCAWTYVWSKRPGF